MGAALLSRQPRGLLEAAMPSNTRLQRPALEAAGSFHSPAASLIMRRW